MLLTNIRPRKFAKHRVFDSSIFRKTRDEKFGELRKKQREERRNVERRKLKVDKTDDRSNIIRSLDIIPRKSALIMSDDPNEQLEATTYFRRILAIDRSPPLAAVYETGVVFPRLVEFLHRFEAPKLQVEAAWCITNIACGDAFYIYALLKLDVLPSLMNVLYQSKDSSVKELSLWALCNISCEDDICSAFVNHIDYLILLLQQLSIAYVPYAKPSVHHLCIVDNPALSSMRHITVISGQILKVYKNLDHSAAQAIVFTFAELLQSPDDEIIQDICQTLGLVCNNERYSMLVLEQGILSRLLELSINTVHRDGSMNALTAIFLNCSTAHKKTILYKIYLIGNALSPPKSIASFFVDYLQTCFYVNGNNNVNQMGRSLLNTLNATPICSSLGGGEILQCILLIFSLSEQYMTQFLSSNLFSVIDKVISNNVSYEGKVEAGYVLCDVLRRAGGSVDIIQATILLFGLVTSTDISLLRSVLHCLGTIFQTLAVKQHILKNISPHFRQKYKQEMQFLCFYPDLELSQLASYLCNHL